MERRGGLEQAWRGEAGIAMALVLVTIVLIMMVSATMVALAMNEYQTAGGAERSRQAIQITDAAIEKGLFELNRDNDWTDTTGATTNVTSAGAWYPLRDGASPNPNISNRSFPESSSFGALGTISVELCRYDAGVACPGVPGSAVVANCAPETCFWMRATGRVGGTSRQIEVLLGKLSPGSYVSNYSYGPINIGAGGGGNGSFRLHGSLYIATCNDPDGAGPQPCVGLIMQGNGEILNDVPLPIAGDNDTTEPYNNRVYVRGHLAGSGNSWQIGLDSQPMRGVHAFGWASSLDNQIDALQKDNSVPFISFPDPSRSCATTTPRDCLLNALHLPVGSPGKIDAANDMVAYVCVVSDCPGVADWIPVDLTQSTSLLPLCASSCPNPFGSGNIVSRVVIPDAASGINCALNPADAARCNAAMGGSGVNGVDGTGNFALAFNGGASPGTVNLHTQRDADTYIHTRTHLHFEGDVVYSGLTTFLIENSDDIGAPVPAVEIRGSVTPLCKVSQGISCAQTFGQPSGDTYAFAVGPACPTSPTSCTPPAGGGIYIRGAGLEVDLILLAHGMLKNDNPQDWYGMFIASVLDWDNNPSIYPVSNLQSNLPPGIGAVTRSGFGTAIFRWREVF